MSEPSMDHFIETHVENCLWCYNHNMKFEQCPEYAKDIERAEAQSEMAYEMYLEDKYENT